MRKTFTYKKFNNEKADNLVTAFNKLVEGSIAGQNATQEYKEANRLFNENLVEYCVEGSGVFYNSLEDVKNPMVYQNGIFTTRFTTILAQAITPAVPAVAATGYDAIFDITQVGFGVA